MKIDSEKKEDMRVENGHLIVELTPEEEKEVDKLIKEFESKSFLPFKSGLEALEHSRKKLWENKSS